MHLLLSSLTHSVPNICLESESQCNDWISYAAKSLEKIWIFFILYVHLGIRLSFHHFTLYIITLTTLRIMWLMINEFVHLFGIQEYILLTNVLQMADRDPNEMEDASCLYELWILSGEWKPQYRQTEAIEILLVSIYPFL